MLLVPHLAKKIPILKGTPKFITFFKVGYPGVFQINDYLVTKDTTKYISI